MQAWWINVERLPKQTHIGGEVVVVRSTPGSDQAARVQVDDRLIIVGIPKQSKGDDAVESVIGIGRVLKAEQVRLRGNNGLKLPAIRLGYEFHSLQDPPTATTAGEYLRLGGNPVASEWIAQCDVPGFESLLKVISPIVEPKE
ncbi:MAG TPA: hypothetical protein VGE01_02200, partial [Fimbriimonas sp.]